jgi:hypothetical protein
LHARFAARLKRGRRSAIECGGGRGDVGDVDDEDNESEEEGVAGVFDVGGVPVIECEPLCGGVAATGDSSASSPAAPASLSSSMFTRTFSLFRSMPPTAAIDAPRAATPPLESEGVVGVFVRWREPTGARLGVAAGVSSENRGSSRASPSSPSDSCVLSQIITCP